MPEPSTKDSHTGFGKYVHVYTDVTYQISNTLTQRNSCILKQMIFAWVDAILLFY